MCPSRPHRFQSTHKHVNQKQKRWFESCHFCKSSYNLYSCVLICFSNTSSILNCLKKKKKKMGQQFRGLEPGYVCCSLYLLQNIVRVTERTNSKVKQKQKWVTGLFLRHLQTCDIMRSHYHRLSHFWRVEFTALLDQRSSQRRRRLSRCCLFNAVYLKRRCRFNDACTKCPCL